MTRQSTVLVVAAHPDDEVLGCGATIARHSESGDQVHVLIVSEGVTSRSSNLGTVGSESELQQLGQAAKKASAILGVTETIMLNLPDNRLDSINRLDLIKEIENVVRYCNPDTIYTHHSGDVNIDHRLIHEAVVTSCRPTPHQTVKKLLSFEVPSSTEWQPPGSSFPFQPNWFVDVSNQLQRKLDALDAYCIEMRPWPHARSIAAVENLARWRGAQSGFEAAEAFFLMRYLH